MCDKAKTESNAMTEMHDSVSICRTCPRDQHDSGALGYAIARKLGERLARLGIGVLMVNCLGACKQPGVVALDSPLKDRIRFSGLCVDDAELLSTAVDAYVASRPGQFDLQALPVILRKRLSAVSPKRT